MREYKTSEKKRAWAREQYQRIKNNPEYKERKLYLQRLRRSKRTAEEKAQDFARLEEWRVKNWTHQRDIDRYNARYAKECERMMQDADYYLMWRVQHNYRRAMLRRKKNPNLPPYTPQKSRWFPDYYKRGECKVDTRSQWLIENATESQRAYAQELTNEHNSFFYK